MTAGQQRLVFLGLIIESKRHVARLKALRQHVERSVQTLNEAAALGVWLKDSPWQVVSISLAARERPYKPAIATETQGEALLVRLDALDAPDPATADAEAIHAWLTASLTTVGRRRGLGPLPQVG